MCNASSNAFFWFWLIFSKLFFFFTIFALLCFSVAITSCSVYSVLFFRAFFNLLCLSLLVIFTFLSHTSFVAFVKAKPHTPNSLSFLWWWWTTDSCVITFFCCSISRHLSFEFLPRPLPNPSISYIPVPSLWVIYFDADFCLVILLTSYSSDLPAVTVLPDWNSCREPL